MRHTNRPQIGLKQRGKERIFWRIPIVMVVNVLIRTTRTRLKGKVTNQNNTFIRHIRMDYMERRGLLGLPMTPSLTLISGGWGCKGDHIIHAWD